MICGQLLFSGQNVVKPSFKYKKDPRPIKVESLETIIKLTF
ncbi:hypothetical protein J2X82_006316 [Priestia megaterium]|nr:hypothetical protein [Priestia megaterium]